MASAKSPQHTVPTAPSNRTVAYQVFGVASELEQLASALDPDSTRPLSHRCAAEWATAISHNARHAAIVLASFRTRHDGTSALATADA